MRSTCESLKWFPLHKKNNINLSGRHMWETCQALAFPEPCKANPMNNPALLIPKKIQFLGSPKLALGGNLWIGPFFIFFAGLQRSEVQGAERITVRISLGGTSEVPGPTSCTVNNWLKICNGFLRPSPLKFWNSLKMKSPHHPSVSVPVSNHSC